MKQGKVVKTHTYFERDAVEISDEQYVLAPCLSALTKEISEAHHICPTRTLNNASCVRKKGRKLWHYNYNLTLHLQRLQM